MQSSFLHGPAPSPDGPGHALRSRPEAPEHPTVTEFEGLEAEAQALREGAGLLDRSDGDRVRVAGPDAAAFLHRLLANDVRGLAPGGHNANLLLTPKGRVALAFDLVRSGDDEFELHLPPGRAGSCMETLGMYHFTEELTIEDESEHSAGLELIGPASAKLLCDLFDLSRAPDPGETVTAGEVRIRTSSLAGIGGFRFDVGSAAVADVWSRALELGASAVGLDAREAVRIEAGEPLFGCEIDDTVYPQEAGLENAFSLEKGCYIGQEVVAKLDTYGGINRKLVGWSLEAYTPIPAGTEVLVGERSVGSVTSWIRSPRLAKGLALGFVKLRALAKDPSFEIAGQKASIVELPLD